MIKTNLGLGITVADMKYNYPLTECIDLTEEEALKEIVKICRHYVKVGCKVVKAPDKFGYLFKDNDNYTVAYVYFTFTEE